MKIKTFKGTTKEDMDEQVNKFEEDNNVKATQTNFINTGNVIVFYATVFYLEPKEDK